jgi:hypothetical protein
MPGAIFSKRHTVKTMLTAYNSNMVYSVTIMGHIDKNEIHLLAPFFHFKK